MLTAAREKKNKELRNSQQSHTGRAYNSAPALPTPAPALSQLALKAFSSTFNDIAGHPPSRLIR